MSFHALYNPHHDERGRFADADGVPVPQSKHVFDGKKVYPGGRDTAQQYRHLDGTWTEERRALHEEIISHFMKDVTPVETPTAYMMGGGPASGKSSLIANGFVKLPVNAVLADGDAIKAKLPEYQKMVTDKDSKAAAFVHEESSYLSKLLVKRASLAGCNVVMDGTGDGGMTSLANKISLMRLGGHKVIGVYATVPTEVAVARNLIRAQKTGRYVPESAIRTTHAAVSRVFPDAVKSGLFDSITLYDTTDGVSKIASATGKTLTVHDEDGWKRFLAKGRMI